MDLRIFEHGFLWALFASFSIARMAMAGDPDITSDFILPANGTVVVENYFTYTGMRSLFEEPLPGIFTAKKASVVEFPSLNGLSVSFTLLQFPTGSLNPPHLNSRSSGLLFLLTGQLEVALIDTSNKLYTQTLQAGDMFLFPKGLVHHQYNPHPTDTAIALASFGNVNAGTHSIPNSLFTTGISDVILAKFFKTDVQTIQKLKAGLVTKA